MGYSGRAHAALGADNGDDPPDRLGFGYREQAAYRADDIERRHRRDQIVADAAPDEFAVQNDVVDTPDHDHTGSRVTDRGKLVEAGENVVASLGFKQDDVRRGRGPVGFNGRCHAAHLNLEMRLVEPAILARGLHGRGGFNRFAEGLNGHARRRSDMLFGGGGDRSVFLILTRVTDHLPTSLSLALSASG